MVKEAKLAIVYTGMPLHLVEAIEREVRSALPGVNLTILTFSNPAIINDAIANGSPSQWARRSLVSLFMQAMDSGADVILNACSSVGDVAEAAKPLLASLGVRLVRIDEEMARTAVMDFQHVGVLATLTSTMEPTKRLLSQKAAAAGRRTDIVGRIAEGTFGRPAEQVVDILIQAACAIRDKVDCIVLAQGSMVSFEQAIAAATGLPVFSSPRFGALAVQRALELCNN